MTDLTPEQLEHANESLIHATVDLAEAELIHGAVQEMADEKYRDVLDLNRRITALTKIIESASV